MDNDGWRPIETHGGRYEVSIDGRVKRSDGFLLKLWANDQGYILARLSQPRVVVRVHRLVAEAFVPNHKKLPFVNHIDCDRANNNASNLEWCTQRENLNHSHKLGRMQRNYWIGKRSPNARLTDETAKAIRKEYAEGEISWGGLGAKYSISKRTVGRILAGESYV